MRMYANQRPWVSAPYNHSDTSPGVALVVDGVFERVPGTYRRTRDTALGISGQNMLQIVRKLQIQSARDSRRHAREVRDDTSPQVEYFVYILDIRARNFVQGTLIGHHSPPSGRPACA